jgi:ATP-dependent Clp protease ATP-binding subunit ClpC
MTDAHEGSRRAEAPQPEDLSQAHALLQRIAAARDEDEYRELRDQLWALGDAAVVPMREALASPHSRHRMAAACNLGRLGDYASIPDIINLLSDPVSTVREMALFGLGILGRPKAIKPILDCMQDYDPDVRVRVLVALRDLRYDRFEAVLIQAMRDEAYNVREQAMAYLRTLATPAALHALLLALLEPEYKMQSYAEVALDRVIPQCNEAAYAALTGRLTPRQMRLALNYMETRNLQEVWSDLHKWLAGQITPPKAERGLDRYGRVLTSPDEAALLERAFLRDEVVSLLVDHFSASDSRKSVLLIGPAGSGKTAVVHQFVRALIEADSPLTVLETNTSELMTNTRYLGEWETKLKEMMEALLRHKNVVLYMKNPNDLLGAGAHSKSDESFADFFRPYLERGALRMIAETTPQLLKSGLARDPGFLRLFEQIRVAPQTDDEAQEVLARVLPSKRGRGERPLLASGPALRQVVDFARSFYTRAESPGRACDLLENAIEYVGRKRARDARPNEALTILEEDVPRAIAEATGIDLALLDDRVPLDLEAWRAWFDERLIAQPQATTSILARAALVKAGMRDTARPLGTLFLVGPTGVGKTYFARLVAERLFGDAERMVRFDLSEYRGRYALERLIGSPHEKDREGLLTEAIRHQPYCVLLLDEFEKADPEIYHLFLQVLDEGRLTDARGNTTDFRQALIMMTSNLGAARLNPSPMGFGDGATSGLDHQIRRKMEEVFQPEFLNRLDDVVVFRPLDNQAIRSLVDLEVKGLLERRGFRRHGLQLSLTPTARDWLAERGFSARFGARELKRCIERDLLAPLSQALLSAPPKANQVAWVEADSDRLRVRVGEGTPDRAATPPAPAAPPSELARRPTRPIPGAP